jgi:hypothetical protein
MKKVNVKNEFQKFIIRMTHSLYSDEAFIKYYRNSNFVSFLEQNLRRYCEYTSEGKGIVWNIGRLKDNCRFTVKAANSIVNIQGKNWKELYKPVIHQEHIFPIAECRNQLYRLIGKNPTIEDVERIIEKSELVIVSQEERRILDKSKYKSTGEPEERLKFMGAQIHPDYKDRRLK